MKKTSDEKIIFRCTVKEKKLLKELAHNNNMNVSDYIKHKVFGRKLTIRVTENGIKEI